MLDTLAEPTTRVGTRQLPLFIPWIVLGIGLLAWVGLAERAVSRALDDVERGVASPRVERLVARYRDVLERHWVVRFLDGAPPPLSPSFVRRAWETALRPQLRGALLLGGAVVCLACNFLMAARRRARLGDDDRPVIRIGVAAVLGLGAASLLAVMAIPLITGTVLTADDLLVYHLPLRKFVADAWARGDLASWCPEIGCGFDLHGEGQLGLDHPVHQVLYRVAGPDVALNLQILGGFAFGIAGMTMLLRRWRLGLGPALFGALTFAFSNLFRRYFHVNAVAVAAHIPWLLLCIDVLAGESGRRKLVGARAAIAALTASQLLLGYPQWVWMSLIAEGLYLLACSPPEGRRAGLFADCLAAKLIGLALGATQLLPTFGALSGTGRAGTDPESVVPFLAFGSWHPLNLLTMACPYAFATDGYAPVGLPEVVPGLADWPTGPDYRLGRTDPLMQEFSYYAGLTPMVLTLVLLLSPRRSRRTGAAGVRVIPFAVALMLFGIALALGRFGPLFPMLARIPPFSLFRCWSRYAFLLDLGLSIVAPLALARLWATGDRGKWPIRTVVGAAAVILSANALALALKAGVFVDPNGELVNYLPRRLFLGLNLAIAATVLGLVVLCMRGARWALVLLALVHVVDLSVFDLHFLFRSEPLAPTMAELCAADGIPPELSRGRVWIENMERGSQTNTYAMRGARLVQVYVGLAPRDELDYGTPEARRVAGVSATMDQWFVAKSRPSPDPLDEVRMVPRARRTDDPRRDLAAIDPAKTALVDRHVPVGEDSDAAPGVVRIVARTNAEYRLRTRADSTQVLVVSTRYDRGWKAMIDDAPAHVIRAYGDYVGCVVPSGTHRVRLTWTSASHRRGRILSAAGLAMLAITLVLPAGVIRWPRRSRAEADDPSGPAR